MGVVYVPNHFAMPADEVRALLTQVGAADLVTAHETGIVATYLPFVFDPDLGEHGALLTHVARNNSQAHDPVRGEALVIVHGADHYVSPRWLPSLAETGQVVPTWNYLTVHAHGELVVHDDRAWTEDVVRRMTAAHEQDYAVDDVPPDYVARMLRAVIGLEVRITRIEAKAKMSQNKAPADVVGIVDGLRDEADLGAGAAAAWMQEHSLPAAQRRADLLADLASSRGRREPREH
jgi:transcriptional regulator